MPTAHTATVLFTDLVASTATMVRLGPRADDVRRSHFALLRGALAASGGREIKTTGDGMMAAYDAAASAIAGAVEMQRAIARYNRSAAEPLAVRIGLSAGDVTDDENDLFGLPVVEAARLCEAADGGGILAADVVRVLAGGRGASFRACPELELKGLPGFRAAWHVDWAEDDPRGGAPLPGALDRSAAGPLVGREGELALLDRTWREAAAGERRCIVLAGEPGIGKTRLAAEQARMVQEQDGIVLLGRCDADLGAPFAPVVEALRRLVALADADLLASHATAHGGELLRLVPELAGRVPDVPAPRQADPDTELLRLHEAVVALLDAAAARQPLLLVLDDVHQADRPTLVLLRHLLRADAEAPVLVLATMRAAQADLGDAVRDVLPELAREPRVRRVDLGAIDEADTVRLLEAAVGHPVGQRGVELARELHDETSGNPLFTNELLRHLADAGALEEQQDGRWRLTAPVSALGLPGSVREIVDQRVRRLGDAAVRLLPAAAVLGGSFDAELLIATGGVDEDVVLDVLDAATAAALCTQDPLRPGRYAFTHAVVQHALAATLGAARAQRLHARAAEALEAAVVRDPGRLSELARHRVAAGDRDLAVDAARRAGDHALTVLAPGEAARWYRTALELLGEAEPDAARRIDLLICLGDAELRAGVDGSREHLLTAAREARRLGDHPRLARAALANNRGMHSRSGGPDAERVATLEAAIDAHRDPGPVRARLLATLGSELLQHDPQRRRTVLSDEALAIARGLGDDGVLAEVLYRRCLTIAEPATLPERLALTAELLDLTERLGDPLRQCLAAAERGRAAMEAGDGLEGVRHAHRQLALAPTCGNAYGRHVAAWAEPWPLAMAGRLDEAEAAANRALQESMSTGQPDAVPLYASVLLAIRIDQGRLAELAPAIVASTEAPDALPVYRALAAVAQADAGHAEAARSTVDAAWDDDRFALPRDVLWLTGMVLWAEACAETEHRDGAEHVLACLLPHRELVAFTGLALHGAVAHAAARLAALLGSEDADALFADAERIHAALPAPVFLARTQVEHGAWLIAGDRVDEGRGLVGAGLAGADACGADGPRLRAEAVLRGMPGRAAVVRTSRARTRR